MKKLFEIKVCGINDQISMDAAVNNSVDYIGLVFYKDSPRNISRGLWTSRVELRAPFPLM